MKIFACAQCQAVVLSHWVEPTEQQRKRGKIARWEPDSKYWKAKGINDIEEAYCGARHSLDRYEQVRIDK